MVFVETEPWFGGRTGAGIGSYVNMPYEERKGSEEGGKERRAKGTELATTSGRPSIRPPALSLLRSLSLSRPSVRVSCIDHNLDLFWTPLTTPARRSRRRRSTGQFASVRPSVPSSSTDRPHPSARARTPPPPTLGASPNPL